jgi:hypothetical protein
MPGPPENGTEAQRRIWLHGVGRSGTSWLMKIFDHHPDVHALHEPEARLHDKPKPPLDALRYDDDDLRDYARRLFETTDLRAVRKKPIMTKAFRSATGHLLRLGSIYAASAVESAVARTGAELHLKIPDMHRTRPSHRVVKCVASPYPIDRIIRANPDIQFIAIIRHPCGTVLSARNGQNTGKYTSAYLPQRSLLSRYHTFDTGVADLREDLFTPLELLSYRWSVYNGLAVEVAKTAQNLRVLRYEDLCADPLEVAQDIFDWVDLDWHHRVDTFLQASIEMEDDATDYHDLRRNPLVAAWKWQKDMPTVDQEIVRRITANSPAAELYDDLTKPA